MQEADGDKPDLWEVKGETIRCLPRTQTWSMSKNHVLDLRKEAPFTVSVSLYFG